MSIKPRESCVIRRRERRRVSRSGSWGLGKPVIVTEGAETHEIPASACLRVPQVVAEEATLFDQMALVEGFLVIAPAGLVQRPLALSVCGGAIRWSSVARQYWQVIESVQDSGLGEATD